MRTLVPWTVGTGRRLSLRHASAYTLGRRRSDCTGALNERGRDLNHLAQLNEMRILNGLTLPWLHADGIVTRVGSNPGDEAGTVLNYLVASEQILRSINHVTVGTDLNPAWSDHRPVRFRWSGYETNEPTASSTQSPERGPMGWRFEGTPSAAQQKIAQERITSDHRLNEALRLIEISGPELAFYIIMEIVRDA